MHTRPTKEAGPSCAGCHDTKPGEISQSLNLPLSLAVSRGVIPRGEADGDIEDLEESLPDMGYNLWPTVGDNIFRDAEGTEEIMEEGLCCFEGCG